MVATEQDAGKAPAPQRRERLLGKGKPKGNMGRETGPASKPVGGYALAADWPVHEVLLSQDWEKPGAAITLLVARRSPKSGRVAAALLLIDLGCLGVKGAQVRMFKDSVEYNRDLRAHALSLQPMAPASLDLAAKIVFTGLEYAARLGFKPDPVYAQAAHLLSGANPDAEPTAVPTGGPDGKPFYVNGPYDDVRKIVEQLLRAVGPGNFHCVIQGGMQLPGLPGDIAAGFDDAR